MARGVRPLIQHPDAEHLDRVLNTTTLRSTWAGVVYRAAEPTYATHRDLLNGVGSRKYGGRWNPPATMSAVYASRSDHSAIEEAKAHFRYYGFDPNDALPRTRRDRCFLPTSSGRNQRIGP